MLKAFEEIEVSGGEFGTQACIARIDIRGESGRGQMRGNGPVAFVLVPQRGIRPQKHIPVAGMAHIAHDGICEQGCLRPCQVVCPVARQDKAIAVDKKEVIQEMMAHDLRAAVEEECTVDERDIPAVHLRECRLAATGRHVRERKIQEREGISGGKP